MHKFFILVFTFITLSMSAQIGTGNWREHFPYRYTIDVCEGNNDLIYCATPHAVFTFNKTDNSIERLFKGHGLFDTDITSINYYKAYDLLLVGYFNGNIDVISQGNTINISDLQSSTITANKTINEIYFEDEFAYLSCGFGIVVVDLTRYEVADTYYLGDNASHLVINDLERTEDHWYAATNSGVYRASVTSSFLSNSNVWEKLSTTELADADSSYIDIDINSSSMYLLMSGELGESIYYKSVEDNVWTLWDEYHEETVRSILLEEDFIGVNVWGGFIKHHLDHSVDFGHWGYNGLETKGDEVIYDENGWFWFANEKSGLGGTNFESEIQVAQIRSPYSANARKLDIYNHNVWVAGGGLSAAWVSKWSSVGVYGMVDETWYSSKDFHSENYTDVIDVAINPLKNSEVYACSWHDGLIHIQDQEVVEVFNSSNSILPVVSTEANEFSSISSVDFDNEGNLWFVVPYMEYPLFVRKANGDFDSFDLSSILGGSDRAIEVFAANNGYIWIVVRGKGIVVYDYNSTLSDKTDDRYILLTSEEGKGGLPTLTNYCIEEDIDGEIWIGGEEGPAIIYSPESIFTDEESDAQQILITQDGNAQLLLSTEVINGISIDGGNRKWIATQFSGVYLLSSDGINQIYHFTSTNSPLLSNTVFDVALNHDNGEVFFATDKGIVSFTSDATNFYEEMDDVQVYPNPIRPEYHGVITIDGLSRDADVKITDIEGNLIYHTFAEGGRATWDGLRIDGSRPATGVYLVFVSNEDGKKTAVSKIAFVK